MSNILIIGANGQLGSEFRVLSSKYTDYIFTFVDVEELDITDRNLVNSFFENNSFDVIINCAAYTAVDKAEQEAELAERINVDAVRYLADVAKSKNIKLVHFSTDYVFDGTNHIPYKEDDKVNPKGVYGITKLKGEQEMLRINPEISVIIRTSWVYSSFGGNFVKTMLKLGREKDRLNVIYDQIGTPTYARDLADATMRIIPQLENSEVEVYHLSNEGVLSWYDFAKEIMDLSDIDCSVFPIETKDYPTLAKRPHYSVLNKSKIKDKFKLVIPYWKDSLKDCLSILNKTIDV
jgi:dTDP-4-dehydrorhamnose reductase